MQVSKNTRPEDESVAELGSPSGRDYARRTVQANGEFGSLAPHDSFGINFPDPCGIGFVRHCLNVAPAERKTMWVNPLLALL